VSRLDHLIREHRAALTAVEKSERTYAGLVAAYQEKYGETVTADFKAADDPRLKQAIADGQYFDRKVLRYGISILVEVLTEGLT
jgi:hypothetical protein